MYKHLLHRLEIEFCKFIRYHIIIYNLLVMFTMLVKRTS